MSESEWKWWLWSAWRVLTLARSVRPRHRSVQSVLQSEPPEFLVVAKISEGASVVEGGRVRESYDGPYEVVYRVRMCADGAWRIARADLR